MNIYFPLLLKIKPRYQSVGVVYVPATFPFYDATKLDLESIDRGTKI
jgi:hypothetical protein